MSKIESYTIEDAIKKAKKTCKCRFDSTVELHINLSLDAKKQIPNIRFSTTLPHGTGKTKKVAVFASQKVPNADIELTESDLDKVEKGKLKPKDDFDVLISEPKYMPKIAKVAKVLGPAGLMPNPKTGTVTDDVEKAVEQIKKGKIEVRIEPKAPIIHTIIGRCSFKDKQLKENFEEIINSLKQNKPPKAKSNWVKTCFITTTMSPSYLVDIQIN